MSADDEDVVFEGSQIHQHLLNVGFTDYESSRQQRETISPFHSYFKDNKSLMLSQIHSLLEELKRRFKAVGASTHTEYWEKSRMFELMAEVFHCPLLNQDDARWLCYSIEQNNNLAPPPENFNWLEFWNSVWGDLLKVPVAASVAVGLASWSVLKNRHQTRLQQLKHLLRVLRIFSKDAKRAFILIQEHELIQRGFIMAQSGAHVWRLEEASPGVTPSLPALRLELSTSLQAVSLHVLRATHALSSAQVSLQPQLRKQINSMTELEKENNIEPTSLAALKWQLHKVLVLESQLLRHLVLCICPAAWLVGVDSTLSPQVFPICTDLTYTVEKLHNQLSLCLRVSIAGDIQHTKSPSSHPREPRLLSLYVALHSASLHAQALLAHTLSAEEMTVDADEVHQDLEQRLTASLAEIAACNSCLQEAQLRLARLTQTCKHVSLPAPPPPPPLPTQVIPVGFTDLEPRGEDQVFEAVCNQELAKLSDSEDEQEIGVQLKMEREVSRHLYLELQSVLAVRAKDWQVREARALGVPVEQLQPTINGPEETQLNEELPKSNNEIAQEYIDLPSPKSMGAPPGSWPLARLPQKPRGPRKSGSCEATAQESDVDNNGTQPVSVALMVAARARQLQQMEDTFGDDDCDVVEDDDNASNKQ